MRAFGLLLKESFLTSNIEEKKEKIKTPIQEVKE